MTEAPRVFISYSEDSEAHAERVLALADALRGDGIDVMLDQYARPAPEEGWPIWMESNLEAAKFVLMICTETYLRRVMDQEEAGKGTGARWEGKLIFNLICYDRPAGSRFIPILLPGSKPEHIPLAVRGHSRYVLEAFDFDDPQYDALYRHLTDQPATPRHTLGPIKKLPPKPRLQPATLTRPERDADVGDGPVASEYGTSQDRILIERGAAGAKQTEPPAVTLLRPQLRVVCYCTAFERWQSGRGCSQTSPKAMAGNADSNDGRMVAFQSLLSLRPSLASPCWDGSASNTRRR